jgi:hypothetical protein
MRAADLGSSGSDLERLAQLTRELGRADCLAVFGVAVVSVPVHELLVGGPLGGSMAEAGGVVELAAEREFEGGGPGNRSAADPVGGKLSRRAEIFFRPKKNRKNSATKTGVRGKR